MFAKKCLGLLLAVLLLAACGAVRKNQTGVLPETFRGATGTPQAVQPESPAVDSYSAENKGFAPPGAAEAYPAPAFDAGIQRELAAPTQALLAQATPLPFATQGPSGGLPPIPQASTGRMILKDAEIELLVDDTNLAVDRVTQLAADQGGYLLSSNIQVQDGYSYAVLRMGVPAPAFESTLVALRGLARQVMRENSSGQDVSAEYTDLRSQLTNLEATAARVRQFLENATTVEESLRINATLSDLEGQIERIKGQMRYYEGRAAYSTISVILRPETPTPTPTPTVTPTPGWSPGSTLDSASSALAIAAQKAVDLLIWLVVLVGPFALVGVLVALLAARVARRAKRTPQSGPTGPGD